MNPKWLLIKEIVGFVFLIRGLCVGFLIKRNKIRKVKDDVDLDFGYS